MTYFAVDDGFWAHPKTESLSDSAVALWTRSGSWSSKYLTDGNIPMRTVLKLGYTEAAAQELVHAGLWHGHNGGFLFHQWSEHQPTKDEVEKKREKWKALKKGQRSAESLRKSTMSAVDISMDSTLVSEGPSPSPSPSPSPFPSEKKESTAPDGATTSKPSAKKREKPKAQQALEAALADAMRARGDVAPALSNSLAQKAAKRVADYATAKGVSLDDAARLLAENWAANGNSNVWKLNDLSFAKSVGGNNGESWDAYQERKKNDPWAGIKQ